MAFSDAQIRAFRLKARAKGFTDAQINQEIARKQQEDQLLSQRRANVSEQPEVLPSRTTAPVARTQPTQQPRTVGGFAKNAIQDVVDFAVNTPIQSFKNLAGVGFETARAVSSNVDERRLEKKRKELEQATRAFKAEKDPVKQKELIAKSRLISKELENMTNSLLSRNTKENPFVKPEELPSGYGEFFGGILKNVGRTFGLSQDESGQVVFNLDTAVQSAYERPVTTALTFYDVSKGATSLAKKGSAKNIARTATEDISKQTDNVLTRTGNSLRRDVLNPKVNASPFMAEEQALLQKVQQDLGLKGSAQAQLKQLPTLFRRATTRINNLLKEAPNTKAGSLSDDFLRQIDEANYGLDDLQFSRAVEGEMNILSKLDGGSPVAQYRQLEKYRDLLKSTRKKIDKGTTLLPKEEARLAAFNALKNTIDTVSPEVKMLNTLQNQMYNIAEGLSKSSNKKGFGVGPIRLPNEATQSAQDLLGRTLERSNTISTRVSSLPKSMGTTASNTLKRIPRGTGLTATALGVRSPLVSESQPVQEEANNIEGDYQDDYGTDNIQDTTILSHPIFGDKTKRDVMLDAFKSGLNQSQLKEIETLYDQFAPEGATVSEGDMSIANDLRKEYIAETKSNNFREITNAYKKVLNAPDTAAGDVSLVFAYMKMLDPTSVVREGEFATAENTAGIPERIVNAYNKALSGKRLGSDQRAGFQDAAGAVYEGYASSQDAIDRQYEDLARRYGIDPTLLGIGTISIPETESSVKKNEVGSNKQSSNPASDLISSAGEFLSKITPTASASDDKQITDIRVEGDNVITEYSDGGTKSENIDFGLSLTQRIGKIFNDVGKSRGLPELNLSELLGYKSKEERINKLMEYRDEVLGKADSSSEAGEDQLVSQGYTKAGEGYYKLKENGRYSFVDKHKIPESVLKSLVKKEEKGKKEESSSPDKRPDKYLNVIEKYFGEEAGNAMTTLEWENYWQDPIAENNNSNGSVDRGIFQINSDHFFNSTNFNNRKARMKKAGIDVSSPESAWEDMKDPEKNIAMAKILYDERGWDPWSGAPDRLLSESERKRRQKLNIGRRE